MPRSAVTFLLLALVAGLVLVDRAQAGEPTELRIEGWWGGLKAADILFTVDEPFRDRGDWNGSLLIRTAGVMKWLTRLVAEVQGRGHLDGQDAGSEAYRQHVSTRKSDRTVEVGFSGVPSLAKRLKDIETYADPSKLARDAENVPDLPEDQRRGTIDPIGGILSLGRRALAGETGFVLPIYDGRRRFDLVVAVKGHGMHLLGGRQTMTVDAVATVHPIAGFKPFHAKWWNNAKFELNLDPRSGLPLQISSSSFLAAVVLTTHAACPPDPDCALPSGR
jgi:hypothetical protein